MSLQVVLRSEGAEEHPFLPVSRYKTTLGLESAESSGWKETVVKAGLVGAAFAGRVAFDGPFAALSSNPVGGALLAASNEVAFGSLYSYASLEWFKDVKFLLSSRSGGVSAQDVALLGVSLIGGTLAQGPVYAQAYLFNHGQWGYVVLTALDALLPVYSLQMSLRYVIDRYRKGDDEKKLDSLKNNILQRLNSYQADFNSFPKGDVGKETLNRRIAQGSDWNRLKSGWSPEETTAQLLSLVISMDLGQEGGSTTCSKVSHYALGCFGHLLTVTLLAGWGYFAFDAVKKISSNNVLAGVSVAGVVLINLYLNGRILSDSTRQIGQEIKDFFLRQSKSSLEGILRPKTTLALTSSAVGCGLIAAVGGGMVWGNQFPDPERFAITALTALMFCVYVLLPMRALAQKVTQQVIRYCGKEEEKSLVDFSCSLTTLTRKITHVKAEDLALFLAGFEREFSSLFVVHELSVERFSPQKR